MKPNRVFWLRAWLFLSLCQMILLILALPLTFAWGKQWWGTSLYRFVTAYPIPFINWNLGIWLFPLNGALYGAFYCIGFWAFRKYKQKVKPLERA
jgi:hypothetical protein